MLCIKLQINGNIKNTNSLFVFLIHTKLCFFSFLLFILTLFVFFFFFDSEYISKGGKFGGNAHCFFFFVVCFYTIGGTHVYIFIQDRGC